MKIVLPVGLILLEMSSLGSSPFALAINYFGCLFLVDSVICIHLCSALPPSHLCTIQLGLVGVQLDCVIRKLSVKVNYKTARAYRFSPTVSQVG